MQKQHPKNERIKRDYFEYMKEARGHSEQSIDAIAAALNRFERFTKFTDFKEFRRDQAIDFKDHLSAQVNSRTKQELSKATILSTVNALKTFFDWLSREPGYRQKIKWRDSEYFTLGRGDTAIAKASSQKRFPTVEQMRHVIAKMPNDSEVEKRDRAIVSFALMTGARVAAIATMQMRDADLAEARVDQDARHVKTKFRKSFPTYLMPVGDEIREILVDWLAFLRTEKLWGSDDPLFPATKVAVGEHGHFESMGLDRKPWKTTSQIREIFKKAFAAVDLPYYNPHSLRHTLAHFAMERCKTPEELKAVSQNLAHKGVLTTFTSYGEISRVRQAEIIRSLGMPAPPKFDLATLLEDVARLKTHLPTK
jgi:integrase/recombinase XerD